MPVIQRAIVAAVRTIGRYPKVSVRLLTACVYQQSILHERLPTACVYISRVVYTNAFPLLVHISSNIYTTEGRGVTNGEKVLLIY